MKNYLLLFSLLFILNSLFGQNKPSCGYEEFIKYQKEVIPDFQKGVDATNQEAEQWIKHSKGKSAAVITIPVVVHLIYNDPSQNLTDNQVKSQIRVLNKDFSRLNSDRVNTPAPFESLAADCEIQFCLAEIDPDGNPTTGITRTFTTKLEIGAQGSSDYFLTANGGADVWDRDSYLNIWVCDVGDLVLGYSTVPSLTTPKNKDGVVIGFEYFGSKGSSTNPNDLGRTTTHEIGHWLGLEHLWGNGDPSGNNCNIDDGIADTPNQRRANYGCPTFPDTSCGNSPNGDMFMNYMDYTDDECMNMFTEGQKTRMQAILNSNPRKSLFNSTAGCSYTSVEEINSVTYLSLSPNPTMGDIELEFKGWQQGPVDITFYTIGGQLIKSEKIIPSSGRISLSYDLPSGIYTLHLKQRGQHFVKKVVIQHQ